MESNWAFFHSPDGDLAEELIGLSEGDTVEEAARHIENKRIGVDYTEEELLFGIEEGIVMAAKVEEWKTNYNPENIA